MPVTGAVREVLKLRTTAVNLDQAIQTVTLQARAPTEPYIPARVTLAMSVAQRVVDRCYMGKWGCPVRDGVARPVVIQRHFEPDPGIQQVRKMGTAQLLRKSAGLIAQFLSSRRQTRDEIPCDFNRLRI